MNAEQVIATAIAAGKNPARKPQPLDYENAAEILTALRAAGLLPGPDTITVNREALAILVSGAPGRPVDYLRAAAVLRAALSEPPVPKEQQPPPFDPDLELMANLEGNRREVRAYRHDALGPSDVPEQP